MNSSSVRMHSSISSNGLIHQFGFTHRRVWIHSSRIRMDSSIRRIHSLMGSNSLIDPFGITQRSVRIHSSALRIHSSTSADCLFVPRTEFIDLSQGLREEWDRAHRSFGWNSSIRRAEIAGAGTAPTPAGERAKSAAGPGVAGARALLRVAAPGHTGSAPSCRAWDRSHITRDPTRGEPVASRVTRHGSGSFRLRGDDGPEGERGAASPARNGRSASCDPMRLRHRGSASE